MIPFKVPMRPDTDLTGLPISSITEKTTIKSGYCMLVGELMYIAINTRPEISYTVNQFSRYMTKDTKDVLHFEIYSYGNTTWVDDKNSHKSTCCYLVFVYNVDVRSQTRPRVVKVHRFHNKWKETVCRNSEQ